jgi:hypothetical protein
MNPVRRMVPSLSLLLVGQENVSVKVTCQWLFVTGCCPNWGLGSSVDQWLNATACVLGWGFASSVGLRKII